MENSQEMGNQQVTLVELGWLAGIIDGEGYIGLRLDDQKGREFRSIRPEIHICNTEEIIVLTANDIMKRLGVNGYIRASKGRKGVKDNYRVTIKRMSQAVILLKAVEPFLIGSKRERANFIIRFCELRLSNPGVRNPNIGNGKRGAGRIKPYTEEEWTIFEKVGPMSRRGTSEAIREVQRHNSEIWNTMEERRKNGLPVTFPTLKKSI